MQKWIFNVPEENRIINITPHQITAFNNTERQ